MEHNQAILQGGAEADRDLAGLVARLTHFIEAIPEMKHRALNAGDVEQARKLERAKIDANETLGMIRHHPIASAHGGSDLTNSAPRFRDDEGKFSGYGSQKYFVGYHARLGNNGQK